MIGLVLLVLFVLCGGPTLLAVIFVLPFMPVNPVDKVQERRDRRRRQVIEIRYLQNRINVLKKYGRPPREFDSRFTSGPKDIATDLPTELL
jgi:hypothetical protein